MTTPARCWFHVLVAVLLLVPATAGAQTIARSFAELQSRLSPGKKIIVTDDSGRKATGKVVSLSPTALVLEVPVPGGSTDRVTFTESGTPFFSRLRLADPGCHW